MNSKPAWVCALSTLILAGTAHAQAAAPQVYPYPPQPAPQVYPYPPQPAPQVYPYPPQSLAHISIQAAPSTTLEVAPSDGAPAVARCTEYCEFWVVPGKYTVYVQDHLSGERKDLPLRIKRSSRFELLMGDDEARGTGLVLAIGGSAALLAGIVAIMPWAVDQEHSTESEQDAAIVGLGLLLAGAITTPIGWGIYGHSRTRLKRIDERSHQASAPSAQLRVGVVGVGLGGLGLGAVGTF